MNYELFIAKRIVADKAYKNSISSPIIKIAVLAIALGIAIMLIAVAVGSGFQSKIRDKMAGFKGHIQVVNYDNNNSDVSTVPISLNQEFYPNFNDVDGVKIIQPYINKAGIIRTETDFQGIVLKGVSSSYDFSFFKDYLVEGRLPNFNQKRNRDIIVSRSIANRLHLGVNDTIQIWFDSKSKARFKRRKPVIVGIYDTGFEQFDNTIVIADLKEVQRINGWGADEVGGFEIFINDFDEIQDKGNEIYAQIGSTLNTTNILSMYPAIFEWINLLDNNVWFIIGIMILIAGINMITALLVLILERVQMVGVLKALGSNNWSIQKIFLLNAAYLIIQGLFWGNLVALILLFAQKLFEIISLNPQTYYVSTVPVDINLWHIILLNLCTLLLCVIMLVIPSSIIAKIHPSKSIKFE